MLPARGVSGPGGTNRPRRPAGTKTQKYVKKPVPVEARQLGRAAKIETLEGVLRGKKGDYLVVGVRGEKYIVKREIFEETYEPVDGRQ